MVLKTFPTSSVDVIFVLNLSNLACEMFCESSNKAYAPIDLIHCNLWDNIKFLLHTVQFTFSQL